mgnify:CR=1 FL=1
MAGAAGLISNTVLTHIATGQKVEVPFVIQSFDYDIKPSWNSNQVYGRMDPIFTYQNTVRSFTAVLRSPAAGEVFTSQQMAALISSGILLRTHFSPPPGRAAADARDFRVSSTVLNPYLEKIATIFKFMYPTYTGKMNDNNGVGFMSAAPLLRLSLNGITYTGVDAQGVQKGLLFVPEVFNVSSISKAEGVAVSIGNVGDMKFAAPAGGYNISLGGTILHEENRVGWISADNNATWKFAQGENFPYSNQIAPATLEGAAGIPAGTNTGVGTTRADPPPKQSKDRKALKKVFGRKP